MYNKRFAHDVGFPCNTLLSLKLPIIAQTAQQIPINSFSLKAEMLFIVNVLKVFATVLANGCFYM